MSTAPRPQTSSTPSALRISSPPNGSRAPAVGVHRHDVGVAHQAQARRRRVAALDAGRRTTPDPASAPSARSSTPGPLDVRLRGRRRCARLVARRRRAVVDAAVADQRLQQLDGRAGEIVRHRHRCSRTPRHRHTFSKRLRTRCLQDLVECASVLLPSLPLHPVRPARLPRRARCRRGIGADAGPGTGQGRGRPERRQDRGRLPDDGQRSVHRRAPPARRHPRPDVRWDGIVETVIEPTMYSIIHDIALQPDGRIVAAGHVIKDVNDSKFAIVRYRAEAASTRRSAATARWSRTSSPATGGTRPSTIALPTDRSSLPGRTSAPPGSSSSRYRADGSPDTSSTSTAWRSSTSRERGTTPPTSPSTRQATPWWPAG